MTEERPIRIRLEQDEDFAFHVSFDAARFGIRSIPTLILFDRGREIARHSGAMVAADILRWVRPHLA